MSAFQIVKEQDFLMKTIFKHSQRKRLKMVSLGDRTPVAAVQAVS
ncbi:hypothetical protein VCHC23A1_3284 [Vibrio cholerae HC-23A1]|nr:hypothetical protein VCHC23A1_3284 [Vibrio cholerae HC-23A1]